MPLKVRTRPVHIFPTRASKNDGKIRVVMGSMFAGKSTELKRVLNRVKHSHKRAVIFRSSVNVRDESHAIKTHTGENIAFAEFPTFTITDAEGVMKLMKNEIVYTAKEIIIEELQFFPVEIAEMCEDLALNGCNITAATLDTNFSRTDWTTTRALVCIANKVVKLKATCDDCYEPSLFSLLTTNEELDPTKPNVGGSEKYKTVCRRCYLQYHHLLEKKTESN